MNPTIKKVAILGSGLMGSRIACHFAGIGVQVLLLDMVAPDAQPGASKAERNKLVNTALQTAIKSTPSPVYTADVPKRISTGNFEDDLSSISTCDWIIEAIVEKLPIKQQLACAGADLPTDQTQDRGFATTRTTHHSNDFTAWELHIEARKNVSFPRRIRKVNAPERNN